MQRIIKKIKRLIVFLNICSALWNFADNENDETTEQLSEMVKLVEFFQIGMPLPSGRYGNSLAVAMEM